ncbi:MAG: hypothetical protein M0Q93_04375 [Terrimicrobiaceae bacterium]|jgi:hypothetical protein|nr:hypothetical protein [Terrimicrobiaceae bacterium]
MDGCHCSVTAERGCEVNQLGSRRDAAANSMNQRSVAAATIEALRADQFERRRLRRRGSLAAPVSGFFL